MKKVTNPISYGEFAAKHGSEIMQTVKKSVQETIKNFSSFKLFLISWKFILIPIFVIVLGIILFIIGISERGFGLDIIVAGIIIFVIGLLLVVFYFYNKKFASKTISNNINEFEVYKKIFKNLNNIEYIKNERNQLQTLKRWLANWPFQNIPYKAKIHSSSDLFHANYKNCSIQFQCQTYKWTEKSGKNETTYYEQVGAIEVDLDPNQDFNDWDFFYKSSLFNYVNMQKVETESREFNKKFKPFTNNQIKIRMMLTPLSMEKMIEMHESLRKTQWVLNKAGNKVLILFRPSQQNLMILNFSMMKANAEYIAQKIYLDLIKDCYEIYSLLSLIIIPPLI